MNDREQKNRICLIVFMSLCGVWLGLKTAPFVRGGLPAILKGLPETMKEPFRITLCRDSFRTCVIMLITAWTSAAAFLSSSKNMRNGEEHGSSRWENASVISKKYVCRDGSGIKILTQRVSIGMDSRRHGSNLNVQVVGGSDSGKTRYFALPNIMDMESSLIILDPNGHA